MLRVNLPLIWCVLCKNVVHCMGKKSCKGAITQYDFQADFQRFYICYTVKSNGQRSTQPEFQADFDMMFNVFYCCYHTFLIRLSDGNRNPTDFETLFQFDFGFCWKQVKRKNWTKNYIVWLHLESYRGSREHNFSWIYIFICNQWLSLLM